MSHRGKNYAITGAGSGMGAATAIKAAQLGAAGLLLADLHEEGLKKTVAECEKAGTNVISSVVDVSDEASVETWIATGVEKIGNLDGAVNCAGYYKTNTPILEDTLENWDKHIRVNMTGVLHCLRAQIPRLNKNGSIVVLSSIAGRKGYSGGAAYAASKWGVHGLVRSVAREIGPRGLRINCIAPGPIETPMLLAGYKDGSTSPAMKEMTCLKRLGQAEEIANVALFMLSEEASYVTGSVWGVDGGAVA